MRRQTEKEQQADLRCDSGVASVGPVHGLDAEEERVKNQDEC